MIDSIRRDIQKQLDELHAEADKLRQALHALGGHDGGAASEAPSGRRGRRASASGARRARAAEANGDGATPAPARTRRAPSTAGSGPSGRSRSGATRAAVLDALAGGEAMTASEVAAASGLGRGTVSTTLSKLAKSGEVSKAERGYRLAAG